MNVSGNIIVFVNEKDYTNEKGVAMTRNVYSTTISKLNQEGEYINAYMDVVFSKNLVEAYGLDSYQANDMLNVDIKDGWLTCWGYEDREGTKKRFIQVFINSADIEERLPEEEAPKQKKPAKKPITKRPLKK